MGELGVWWGEGDSWVVFIEKTWGQGNFSKLKIGSKRMFVKFCEAKHNLAKNCLTIGLGTMQFFADDNPDFFRFDYSEGAFKVTNDGASMHIDKGSIDVPPVSVAQGFGVQGLI